ncbi:MAG: hypothetical protein QM708_10540 [Propioniciclava sp.]|uniref:hypothetical protein n=1 Tax=Propioniciclava sp. TaxID=2038686 RepID=UPI0039E5FDF1
MAVMLGLCVPGIRSAHAESPSMLGEQDALVRARSLTQDVEVTSLTNEWRRVVARPSGVLSGEYTVGVARVRDGRGSWRDPDPTLRRGPDGRLSPVASRVPISVSTGGEAALASLESGAERLALGWRGSLPEPVVDGDTATYEGVYPGVDLVVRVGADMVGTYLIVHDRAAAANPEVRRVVLDVETSGLPEVRADDAGGVAYRTASGQAAFGVSVATMWDATGREMGAEPAELVEPGPDVRMRKMELSATTRELAVVPDAAFLDDPATVYPVTIDPVVYANSATLSQRVTPSFTQTNHTGDAARVGYNGWSSPYYPSEMYYRFGVGSLDTGAVRSLVFRHDNVHSVQYSPCYMEHYGHPIEVGITNWVDANTSWSNRPAWLGWPIANDYGVGNESTCAARATVAWDLTGPFQSIHGSIHMDWDLTIGMRGTGGNDKYTWREFYNQFGAGSASRPLLSIEYVTRPAAAQSVSLASSSILTQTSEAIFTPTKTPTLQAVMPTSADCPNGLCQRAVFEIWNEAGTSMLWWGLSPVAAPGATVQATSMTLAEGTAYQVRAWVENTHYWMRSETAVSAPKKVRVSIGPPAKPTLTFAEHGAGSGRADASGRWSVTAATTTPYVTKYCWAVGTGQIEGNLLPSNQCVASTSQQKTLSAGPLTFDATHRFRPVQVGVQYATGEWAWASNPVNVYPHIP